MIKIPSARQIRDLDAFTIAHEPIASIDLMERASHVFVRWFAQQFPLEYNKPICVFCGPGNNGGDGLAVARLLHELGYPVRVWLAYPDETSPSADHTTNLSRLRLKHVIDIHSLNPSEPFPTLPAGALVIDALYGSGLNRPLSGPQAQLIEWLNEQPLTRIAIDIPSGLLADDHCTGPAIRAHYTLSFQFPKLCFLQASSGLWAGDWHYADIGLSPAGIAALDTPYFWMDSAAACALRRPRHRFDHKGVFGHALVIAGSYGKVGAAILCSKAVLRAGAGLVSVHVPKRAYEIMQIAFPEAMVEVDRHLFVWSETGPLDRYAAIGLGPGLGTDDTSAAALFELLNRWHKPMVIDADALNLLALHPHQLQKLPAGTILTPHPKEFERLFGHTDNDYSRLALLRQKAQELGLVIVLKTAYTAIASPDGQVFFNSTGNPGMGTAGTGDVLTGIITGLLAQSYAPLEAACLGVYLHGLAGDLAAAKLQQESLIADDLIQYLGQAFSRLPVQDAAIQKGLQLRT